MHPSTKHEGTRVALLGVLALFEDPDEDDSIKEPPGSLYLSLKLPELPSFKSTEQYPVAWGTLKLLDTVIWVKYGLLCFSDSANSQGVLKL